ncbi:hypothetical protein PISL3812_04044 [Talaromyces islandicus]|uniref:Cell wall mannoprotein 1 n=1 Tax=Talaromyces islandicus TaxID=28573 RepID=A0A0U1LWT3_TALIS|nr:hypothetical protein PISL3812_04044 [Talaromyces islandicus]
MKFLTQVSLLVTLGFTAITIATPVAYTPTKVKRDLNSIESVLTSIGNQVTTLDGYIKASPPNPTQIVNASTALISTIKSGVTTVQASANLSDTDALGLVSPVQTLANNVNTTITDLIGIKSTVDKLDYGCTTYKQLEDQLTAATSFSTALVSKVPAALQSIAQGLAKGITTAIQNGVTAYNGECSSTAADIE